MGAAELRAKRERYFGSIPTSLDGERTPGRSADVRSPNESARFIPSGRTDFDQFARPPQSSLDGAVERASAFSGVRSPHFTPDALDAFRVLVTRARVARILRERAAKERPSEVTGTKS